LHGRLTRFNPWIGCSKVSQGCENCYAEVYGKRFGVEWGYAGTRRLTSHAYWAKVLRWNEKAAKSGNPVRVFCGSLCDVFEAKGGLFEAPAMGRAALWELIEATSALTWLLLTKRPENIRQMIPLTWSRELPPNVWIGTSVENQEWADIRIPELIKMPAKHRFLSCEPLLGLVDFNRCSAWNPSDNNLYLEGIDWVIAGGESGPNARPMHPNWVRSLRDQCIEADVPFFFKQWGEFVDTANLASKEAAEHVHAFTRVLVDPKDKERPMIRGRDQMFRVGKRLSDHLLDGREWHEVPGMSVPDARSSDR
jgi:protein gp37